MPDVFPTLEVTAGLYLLVLVVRFVALSRSIAHIQRVHERTLSAIESEQFEAAEERLSRVNAPIYVDVAQAIVKAIRRTKAKTSAAERRHSVELAAAHALRQQSARVQSARARDLIILAVLGGAAAYAHASLEVANVFYALLAGVGALLVASFFVRKSGLSRTERAAAELVEVAVAHHGPGRGQRGQCPVCGGREAVASAPEKLKFPEAPNGLEQLRVCQACGHVRGRANTSENPTPA